MSIQLFKHNKTAYKAADHMLSERGKAAVIHPTGTRKASLDSSCARIILIKLYVGFLPHATYIRHSLKTLLKLLPDINPKM